MPQKLTDKQKAFIEFYLKTWNATQAAKDAGYSERSARFLGPDTLSKPVVQEAIAARMAELKMSADEVLVRLTDHARGSIAPFMRRNPDGELYGFDLSDEKPLNLLHKVTITKRTVKELTEEKVSIELYDAQAALALLARHHGLLIERTETTINVIDDAVTTLERKLLPRVADDAPADVSGEPDPHGEGGAAL